MNDALVSVIIPTYNRINYLQIAIESVLGQIYKNYELIVIDDGSTDSTREVIREKYGDKVIYIWQENQGESSARNHGVSIAKGEYIAFLDSDDIWHPNKLLTQVSALNNSDNRGAVLAYSSGWVIDENGYSIRSEPVGVEKSGQKLDIDDLRVGPKIFGPASNMLIKSNYIKEIGGFDATIRFGEDWDLVIHLRSKGYFVYINQPLFYIRIHGNSQQGIPQAQLLSIYLQDMLTIVQKNAHLLFFGDPVGLNKRQAKIYEKVAAWSFVRENWDQGMEYLLISSNLFQDRSSKFNVATRIGYWAAVVLLEKLKSPKAAEDYFLKSFLPNLLYYWPSMLGRFPKGEIVGTFYQTLAFRLDKGGKIISQLCLKAIVNKPRFLFSPKTITTLFKNYGKI